MPFIAKNPLILPKIKNQPFAPVDGTRGLFPKEDGWYDIDSNGFVSKLSAACVQTVTIKADKWEAENVIDNNGSVIGVRYGQKVVVENAVITPNSKVDLQISSEQAVIFREKSLAFVAENDDGVVTIYCVGDIPKNDYTMQVTVSEVIVNG